MILPRYTRKDGLIMITMLTPVTIVMNLFLFGHRYFAEWPVFIWGSIVTLIIHAISWQFHTAVAVILRNRFPEDSQMFTRIPLAIGVFILMTSLCTTIIFFGYDYTGFLGYRFNESYYTWAIIFGIIENIFITFLHEGVNSYEKWKTTIRETETLKKEYIQSQLMGLKTQVSPHFLFNSLNTLSSLISEDPTKAERFLDEMSKVYRYLLRNNEDPLVPLSTEIQFIESYFHLLRSRYGASIEVAIEVPDSDLEMKIPPFTLQTMVENTIRSNRMSKDQPLKIHLYIDAEQRLCFMNSNQPKIGVDSSEAETGLQNISNQYRLLAKQELEIRETTDTRIIRFPVINENEIVAA
jgi:two-component system, LytTR family, sensor kinase